MQDRTAVLALEVTRNTCLQWLWTVDADAC